ncbi:MAG TPA: MlaD family protein, partial [Steroidobacteraceae bacterium]|nr:MlaD family protein [Steroidobacteraceae bacterium]
MERDANYVAVGAFMLLLVAMAVGFVLWYSKAGDSASFKPYEIYFEGNVSGLNKGSTVRYLGVDVGRVRRMSIDPKSPSRVRVIVDIDDTAPISAATRASLNMQGVTGLLFVNLKQVPGVDPTLPLPQGERYPMIESMSSDFDVLLTSLPDLVGRASTLIENIDKVFSEKNLTALSQTLENLRATTQGLPKTATKVSELIDQLKETLAEVNSAAAGIRGIADDSRPQVKHALEGMKVAADNLSHAAEQVNKFVNGAEGQLTHLSDHGLFELERLLRDARAAASEFRDLSRSLKQQPSQIMFEKPVTGM